ncbi:MAG TPA: chloride channel protein [Kofleriaceae bacterium]
MAKPPDDAPKDVEDEPSSPFAVATAAMLRPMRELVRPVRGLVALITPADQPLELQIVGRTLLHAALVGLGAGLLGCLFFVGAELLQTALLDQVAGYETLHADGERIWNIAASHELRWWLVLVIPTLGALGAGLLMRFAPECRGGGGDATIEAFHREDGVMRRRVLWIKPLASIATLGTGGSGGREGPTMQIGGALGSTIGRYLRVSARERRVLMVAGVAAGISAVFRAPLGAALIAIEMLYRDDFESEALIPSVLASVIAYSVSISVFGQSTLFGHLATHAFRPQHIPLYILLAIFVSAGASVFVGALRLSHRLFGALRVADWLRPALGGFALGAFVLLTIHYVGPMVGRPDRGLGDIGGGYGGAQVAISGADWIPSTWTGVEVLLLLAIAKIIATSFTIGSGGSAGDFAPSLAVGALLGGAFGLAAQLILDDPSISPGAFALVGMGTFYGGIANTPLAALVLVCEMAGSYDLLVPLMLAEGVAFVALRRVSLYRAQVPTLRDSPVHKREIDPLHALRCRDVVRLDRPFVSLKPNASLPSVTAVVEIAADQDVFPVVDPDGMLCGILAAESLRIVASNPELHKLAVVADLMSAPASAPLDQALHSAAQLMIARDLRSLPITDATGTIVGLLDEHEISAVVLGAHQNASAQK